MAMTLKIIFRVPCTQKVFSGNTIAAGVFLRLKGIVSRKITGVESGIN